MVCMYSGSPPTSPAIEEILTMRPPSPRSIMRLPTAWDIRNVPCTLTCITRSNFSSGISSAGAPHVAPLLLTRMSIAPKASSVSFTTLATSSGSVTSQARARALPPRSSISAFTSSSASRLREQRTTLAPASERASAMYCPRPRPPPVTTAVLPSRRNRSSAFVRAASVSILLLLFLGLRLRSLCLRPLLVGEHAPQELPDGALGQLVAEFDGFGGLVGGEALLAEDQDLLLRHPAPGPLYHESLDRLAPVLVRDADGHGLGHLLVLEEDLLDLARVDVVAARGDHVLL